MNAVTKDMTTRPGAVPSASLPRDAGRPGAVLLTDWRKVCGCGRAHNWHQWNRLAFVARQVVEYPDDGMGPPIEVHEYRNCPCKSTLVVDLLTIIDLVRPGGGS